MISLFHSTKHSDRHHGKHEMKERVKNIGHDPSIDWLIILIIAMSICALLVTNGFYVYVRVGETLSQPPAPAVRAPASINPDMLTHVLEQFETRARERASLIKTYNGPTDPSI